MHACRVQLSLPGSFYPWDFSGKNTGVGGHFRLQGALPDPGIEPMSPALAGRFFTIKPPGKPQYQPQCPLLLG